MILNKNSKKFISTKKGRSQAGPKGRQLEVGAQHFMAAHIYFPNIVSLHILVAYILLSQFCCLIDHSISKKSSYSSRDSSADWEEMHLQAF